MTQSVKYQALHQLPSKPNNFRLALIQILYWLIFVNLMNTKSFTLSKHLTSLVLTLRGTNGFHNCFSIKTKRVKSLLFTILMKRQVSIMQRNCLKKVMITYFCWAVESKDLGSKFKMDWREVMCQNLRRKRKSKCWRRSDKTEFLSWRKNFINFIMICFELIDWNCFWKNIFKVNDSSPFSGQNSS